MRAHARRYTVTESGTRHELPDGGLAADRVRELLKLVSNQACGFVRVSYVSEQKAATKLRPIGSALYFLMTLQAPVKLHRIRNDQLYHDNRGDPLELLLLKLDGSSEKAIIGPDLAAGEHVQFFIPRATFRTARDRTAALVIGRRCRAGRRRSAGEKVSTRGGRNSELHITSP
jgi:predicted cupin superfamily sugar epimerase